MKKSKLPQQLAKNASKMHKLVGKILADDMFAHWEVRQEYPVNQVNKSFPSGREKFDWVILGLNVVVEVHGKQHYCPVCFGGVEGDEAKRNFRKRIEKDWEKEQAAREAGWSYVVVKYDEKDLTLKDLWCKISEELAERNAEEIRKKPQPKKVFKIPHPKKYNWPTRKIPSRPFNNKKD